VLGDDRDRIGVRNATVAATALAWGVVIGTAATTGTHAHAAGTAATRYAASAALDWLLMLTAMMAPVLVHPLQLVRAQSLTRRRTRATLLFLAGYASIWTVAGAAMLSLAATIRSASLPSAVPAVAALALALVVQCSPFKQVTLNRCHAPTTLAAFGSRADTDAIRFGATYAAWCIGSCGAWMFVPLVLPEGHLVAMVAVTVLVFCERLEKPASPAWRWRGLGRAWRVATRALRARPHPRWTTGSTPMPS
jgi:predicted metal-binding membrane protein